MGKTHCKPSFSTLFLSFTFLQPSRYNDQPHGEFGLDADLQAVEVNAADMSRHVKVVVSRLGGTFGRVLASYTISYDLVIYSTGVNSNYQHRELGIFFAFT